MKILLTNGCFCSQLKVFPSNWNTKKAKVNTKWYIGYRFYDPRCIKSKQVMLKGMNSFLDLDAKQTATQKLLSDQITELKNGYNPFEV